MDQKKPTDSSSQQPQQYRCCRCSKKTKARIEKVALALGCILICLIFIGILVYYYIDEYAVKDADQNITLSISTSNDTVLIASGCNGSNQTVVQPVTLCTVYGIGVMPASCNSGCTEYTGVCAATLATWKSCAVTNQPPTVHISSELNKDMQETNMNTFLQYLGFASRECQQIALPLFCLYTFPLCDCSTQKMYRPTRSACENMRDSVCRSEWIQVQFADPALLPDCSQLPETSTDGTDTDGTHTSCSNETTDELTSNANNSNFTCAYDFIEDGGYCWPHCHIWRQDSEAVSLAVNIVQIISLSIGLLLTLVSFVFVIYEYKKMFSYPHIFLTFVLIDYFFSAMFVLISLINPNLYCSHVRLDISRLNPTVFCTMSGIVFQYTGQQSGFFAICHIGNLFYSLYFPFSKKTESSKRRKILYIALTLAGILFPALVIGIGFSIEGFQYQQFSFPTSFCTPNMFSYWLYAFVIPVECMLSVGCCLILFITWRVCKHQGLITRRKKSKSIIPGPEKKLLWIFSIVLVFGILTVIYSILSGTLRDRFSIALTNYFACENDGHVPGKCDRSEFERYSTPYLAMLAYISISTLPIFALNFLVDCKCLLCRGHRSMTRQSTTTFKLKSSVSVVRTSDVNSKEIEAGIEHTLSMTLESKVDNYLANGLNSTGEDT